jgi:hypothetical protein
MTSALLAPLPPADPTERPEPTDDGTRRQFLAGLAAAGLLVGCGSGDEGSVSPATRSASRPSRSRSWRSTATAPRRSYPAAELTVASVYLESDHVRINGRELGVLTLALDDFGVSWAALTDRANTDGGQSMISYERIGRLDDADIVFRHAFSQPSAGSLRLLHRLPAGRAGQVHDEPNIAEQTYPTLNLALDYLEPRLLDADPRAAR